MKTNYWHRQDVLCDVHSCGLMMSFWKYKFQWSFFPTGQSLSVSSALELCLYFPRFKFMFLWLCWKCVCVHVLYWKANRNMSTTLMTMSNIMIMNTTTFWVSGGRLQRSMVFRNPILCLLHLPEPLPRAISLEASSSSFFFSSLSSATPPLLCIRSRMKCRHQPASPPLGWSLVLSNSVTLLRCLAVLIVSSASPATLLMHRIALACQWRLGALLLAVVNLAWWS